MIELQPFEVAPYEGKSFVLKKQEASDGCYITINENQWQLLKFLKESKNLLSLLLPSSGIATKNNMQDAIDLFQKLRKLDLVNWPNRDLTEDRTADLVLPKKKIQFHNIDSLSAIIIGVCAKFFGFFPPNLFLLLLLTIAAAGLVVFPFELALTAAGQEIFSYGAFFLTIYASFCLGFSMRTLLQAGFLQANKRNYSKHRIKFYGPFLALGIDSKDIYMNGRGARIRLALVGILAPLSLILLSYVLFKTGIISFNIAFAAVAAWIGNTLLLLCPLLSWDGTEIIHSFLNKESLEQKLSQSFHDFLSGEKNFQKKHVFLAFLILVWFFLWTDFLRLFADYFSPNYLNDLYFSSEILKRSLATLFFALLYCSVAFPTIVFFYSMLSRFFREKAAVSKKQEQEKKTIELSFEEQMAALENIPLFAALDEEHRTALFHEMRSQFFVNGSTLVTQGETGNEFFVLVKGKAKTVYQDAAGKIHYVGDLQEGDAFGEIALIDEVPRTASVVSQGGCSALILKKEDFEKFLDTAESPDAVKQMIRLTNFFRRHPLFSKLSAKDQAGMIENVRFEFITTNEELSGDRAENIYIVYSGKLKVDTGDDSTDLFLQAEDLFGYAGNAAAIRITAIEGAGVLGIKEEDFRSFVWEKLADRPGLFL